MKRRALLLWMVSALIALSSAAAGAVSVQIASNGTFALAGATSHIRARMVATALASSLAWDLEFTLAHTGAPIAITRYDTAMTQPMHLIAINDAFTTFQHFHPRLDRAGTFHLRMQFPKSGYYHLYADTTPHGNSRQVFRFDFVAGALTSRPPARKLGPPAHGKTSVRAGPYRVVFDVPKLTAGAPAMLGVHISKAGAPARDLRPYLGAAAHIVMIDAHDLSYIHVHPMLAGGAAMSGAMSGMKLPAPSKAGPALLVHVTPKTRGTYKLWLQFANAAGAVYVAPLVLAVT